MAEKTYDNKNRGMIAKNKRRREGKNDAEYAGFAEIECPCCKKAFRAWLKAWVNTAKNDTKMLEQGEKYFGVVVQPQQDDARQSSGGNGDASDKADDDIPF